MTEQKLIILIVLAVAFVIAVVIGLSIFIVNKSKHNTEEEMIGKEKKLRKKDFEESLRRNEGNDN